MKRIALHLGGFLLLIFLPFLMAAISWGNYSFALFSLLWILLIGLFLFFWIKAPLKELFDYTENLRRGLPSKSRLTRRDDLYGYLAKGLERLERSHTSHLSTLHGRMEEIQAILSSVSEGVVATEITGRINLINPAAAELFSLLPGQGVGEFPYKVFPQSELGEIFHQVYVKGYPLQREIIWPGNPDRVLNLHLAPIRGDVDEIRGVVAVIGDITKLRQLETMRQDFVANVSHELKTPLTSIKGFVEILMDSALDDRETTDRFLSIINQEAERLNNLIHDLLDISKLESGQTTLNKKPVHLDTLLDEIILSVENRLREKNLELKRAINAPIMQADEGLLREVIINLVDNAIKYTPEGAVITLGSDATEAGVRFFVKDNGFGIPEESRSRIFERFYRVDKGRSREMGGTGLGLSIVKHIIDRHGGKVAAESELGKGSEFWFILPFKTNGGEQNGAFE